MTAGCLFGGRRSCPGVVWRGLRTCAATAETFSGFSRDVSQLLVVNVGGAVNGVYHRNRLPGFKVPSSVSWCFAIISG